MRIKTFVLAFSLLALLVVTSCQQGGTPTAPKPMMQQQTSSRTAATSANADDLSALKPDKKAGNPALDETVTADFAPKDVATVANEPADIEVETEPAADAFLQQMGFPDISRGLSGRGDREFRQPADFHVRIQPNGWNKNWKHSDGLVTAQIVGAGFEDIDPESLQMSCGSCAVPANPETISPVRWKFGTYCLAAKFSKSDAIGLIADPQKGETYQILISFSLNDTAAGSSVLSVTQDEDPDFSIPFTITILGRKPEETELNLVIRPKKWNRAWANPEDEDNGFGDEDLVTARISGEGFDEIVPGSLLMSYGVCADPVTDTISPVFEELGGISYVAKFLKNEAIALIEDPKRDERHPIRVTGAMAGGATFCLSYEIIIVGKKPGEGPLTLEIKPDTWNMSWLDYGEDGEVTARIKGEDFEKIDPATIQLVGPEGAITPQLTEFAGFAFVAKFEQSRAIGLIPSPPLNDYYEVQIAGAFTDGTPLPDTLRFEVCIKKKKG